MVDLMEDTTDFSDSRRDHAAGTPSRQQNNKEGRGNVLRGQGSRFWSPAQTTTLEQLAAQLYYEKLLAQRFGQLSWERENLSQEIAVCARLVRVHRRTRRALVKQFQALDREGFAECFNAVQNLKETCLEAWTDRFSATKLEHGQNGEVSRPRIGLFNPDRLSPKSRSELLELLRHVRQEPAFLADRFRSLSADQLLNLVATPDRPTRADAVPTPAPYARNSMSTARRNAAYKQTVKDHIGSLERNDAISMLLHNVYSIQTAPSSSEAERRLDTWSTVCAKLYTAAPTSQKYHPLLFRVLDEFADLAEWTARPRLELLLRDILQKSAFLLEFPNNVDLPTPTSIAFIETAFSPNEAGRFIEQALLDIFSALNDREGGLPRGSLELGSAILGKLGNEELQRQFRGFLLVTWFFERYLYSFITAPESHGVLLDQHIRNHARYRVFPHLAGQATELFLLAFEDGRPPLADAIIPHVHQMNNCLEATVLPPIKSFDEVNSGALGPSDASTALPPLILAPLDLVSLIDALYPRSRQSSSVLDPFMTVKSSIVQQESLSAFPAQAVGSMYLHDNIPIHAKARSTAAGSFDFIKNSVLPPSASRTVTGSRRFEQLRKDLGALSDADFSAPIQPLEDAWISVEVSHNGKISWTEPSQKALIPSRSSQRQLKLSPGSDHDLTKEAAARLAEGFYSFQGSTTSSVGYDRFHKGSKTLQDLFKEEIYLCHSKADSAGEYYWSSALGHFTKHYPVYFWTSDDSKILEPLLNQSKAVTDLHEPVIRTHESQLAHYRTISTELRKRLTDMSKELDIFRNKMWYTTGVRDSQPFEQAKNITTALNHMSLEDSPRTSMEAALRGRVTSRPSISSLLKHVETQTADLLKAPAEYGCSQKLADDQIERTARWMFSSNIENFCAGEERIHRFCLEIRETVNRLVGDSMLDGRFLWASDLFSRERQKFEVMSTRATSNQFVTRPPSVMSDDVLSLSHYNFRGQDSFSRPSPSEIGASPGRKGSFHSLERARTGRDVSGFDTASTSDSPVRTISTVASDSVVTYWSPAVTQAQSATSIYSNQSRPASVHEAHGVKPSGPGQLARAEFLHELKHSLVSLLLSDLSCPVWSTGCETDAWISDHLGQSRIKQRMQKRIGMEQLILTQPANAGGDTMRSVTQPRSKRSSSAGPTLSSLTRKSLLSSQDSNDAPQTATRSSHQDTKFSFPKAFVDILQRFSAEADPRRKLQALHDLQSLAYSSIEEKATNGPINHSSDVEKSEKARRRASLPSGSSLPADQTKSRISLSDLKETSLKSLGQTKTSQLNSEDAMALDRLKEAFLDNYPRTLFRDLQFVSAFVPSEVLAEPENARALLLTGLAALALKEDICRTLVGVADRIVSQDLIKRRIIKKSRDLFTVSDAIKFWTICAKEGNSIAQRELAYLYLSHPSLPKFTNPMSLLRDVFDSQPEVSLRPMTDKGIDLSMIEPSAIRLALHWMHVAASNGDKLAQDRLLTV